LRVKKNKDRATGISSGAGRGSAQILRDRGRGAQAVRIGGVLSSPARETPRRRLCSVLNGQRNLDLWLAMNSPATAEIEEIDPLVA